MFWLYNVLYRDEGEEAEEEAEELHFCFGLCLESVLEIEVS